MYHVERSFYEDGILREECHYRGKLEHGLWRRWHPSGMPANECWYDDGECRDTIVRGWHPNGQIALEHMIRNGEEIGRFCVWDEDRNVMMRYYIVDNKKVSREAYRNACEVREDLPRYPEEYDQEIVANGLPLGNPQQEGELATDTSGVIDALLGGLHSEARSWLERSMKSAHLGEMTHEESCALVNLLYHRCAYRVVAADIPENVSGPMIATNHIIVELPINQTARAKLFEYEREFAENQGFTGEADRGQRYVYFKMA